MGTASKILIVGGVATLGYSALLGVPLAAIRSKAPVAPRYLIVAHSGAVISGAVLLGLAFAATAADLSAGWATTGAWLAVGGAAAIVLGDTVSWLMRVQDGFAARSIGWKLNATGAPVFSVGLFILLAGVIKGV